MLIDWFTVVAQAINFLVLVWLLKRYLYRPILSAVDAREQRVAARLAEAEARERQAASAGEALERERVALAAAREERLAAAAREAAAERERLLEAARRDADAQRARLTEALALERENRLDALTTRLGAEVLAVAGQVLGELADEPIALRMAARCLERLRQLPPDEREALRAAMAHTDRPVHVRTAVELPEAMRHSYERALAELLPGAPRAHFEVARDLMAGVELVSDGRRWSWTIDDYLRSLERLLREESAATDAGAGRAA